jgi:L-alanine-DL-glutamate epimerase-like enolase superfamily enzyme
MGAATARESADSVRLRRIEAWALRAPIERAVETSFGVMRDRPAVFLRIEDAQGCFGFGEIWCNFPGCGAEHRVRLLIDELAPLLSAAACRRPHDAYRALTDKVRIRALQSGEAGPYRQVIAGLDIALWDLCARAAGEPLRLHLDPAAPDHVPAYASGIHIGGAPEAIGRARENGFSAFKVKVGFDTVGDLDVIGQLSDALAKDERLLADANQAWALDQALDFAHRASGLGLGWLEEPLAADADAADWRRLAEEGGIPLAAGENLAGEDGFQDAIGSGALAYIQPDIAKWGGFSGCLPVARAALKAGLAYCPHFLGGGIGLAASAHLLAAAGGPGLLEIDANPNPLREAFAQARPSGGALLLTGDAGLGIEQIPPELERWVTLSQIWRG